MLIRFTAYVLCSEVLSVALLAATRKSSEAKRLLGSHRCYWELFLVTAEVSGSTAVYLGAIFLNGIYTPFVADYRRIAIFADC